MRTDEPGPVAALAALFHNGLPAAGASDELSPLSTTRSSS